RGANFHFEIGGPLCAEILAAQVIFHSSVVSPARIPAGTFSRREIRACRAPASAPDRQLAAPYFSPPNIRRPDPYPSRAPRVSRAWCMPGRLDSSPLAPAQFLYFLLSPYLPH